MADLADDLAQRLAALQKANAIRSDRAKMKEYLRAGGDPCPLLNDPPSYLATMRVEDFLAAVRGIGPKKARRLLARCKIGEGSTFSRTSSRKRALISDELARGKCRMAVDP